MCGIAGLIGWEGRDDQVKKLINNMQSSLYHRGPDSKGIWHSHKHKIIFIHTRLSIIDLSKNGNQPMLSSCERYIVSFNGEIYNHLKLREELKQLKHNIKWKGTSDTETLLESISLLGLDKTLSNLRGMFAFSLYDKKNKKIYLIRDRFGEKPLYLLNLKNGIFAFASEISPFSFIPGFSQDLDLRAVASYFQRGYIGAPLSIFKNVQKIMPGTKMVISLGADRKYSITSEDIYWSAKKVAINGQKNLFQGSYEKCKEELENILFEVLNGQSLSDVPLGVFLSGGIDSSGPYTGESYDAAALIVLAMQAGKSADRASIAKNVMGVANGPGTKIYPGELKKGLDLLAKGKAVDYEGATGVNFTDVGEAFGSFLEQEIKGGKFATAKQR